MSPLFIKSFKSENKCPCCKASPREGYSVCDKHLHAAKTKWRSWSLQRKAEGKCCYCKNKSYQGQLRCKTHKAKNKQYCHDWWIRKVKTTPEGFCKQCPERKPVLSNRKTCQFCYSINCLRRKGYKVSSLWSIEQLNAFILQNNIIIKF